MKIWCCLCFNEEENKEAMNDSGRENEGNLEGVGNEESEELNLGLSLGRRENVRLFQGIGFELRDLVEEDRYRVGLPSAWHFGDSWQFDQFASSSRQVSMRGGGGQVGFEGESSSAAATDLEREVCDCDPHHKRAKVHSNSHECHYTTVISSEVGYSSSRAYTTYGQGSFPSNNEIFYHTSALHSDGYKNLLGSSSGKDDEENDSGASEMEDSEVRMDLTDDLLHMVFSFLDHINLCRAAMVCKQWRTASAHEDFWRCLNFENMNISADQFEDMCRRYPNATEVNIFGVPAIHVLVMKAVSSLRNLESLNLGKGQLGDAFFHALADCGILKSLIINDAILGNGIQEMPIFHDRLRHLQITKCRVLRISIRCPQLETLSLKRSNMAYAVLNCPLLHDLDIGSCHKLSDAAIHLAAISCPLLESLDMSNCSCVSDDTLREIASSCASLRILNASYCPNI